MQDVIFEFLKRAGYIRGNVVNREEILKTDINSLIDLTLILDALTSVKDLERQNSIFSHSVSSDLSGGRECCIEEKCRRNRANYLAQYAALYSDCVYIPSYFGNYFKYKISNEKHESIIKYNIATDIAILIDLMPLLNDRIVRPFSLPIECCPRCLINRETKGDATERANAGYEWLVDNFLNQLSVTISYKNGKCIVTRKAPQDLMAHRSMSATYEYIPESILRISNIAKKIKNGETVELNRSQIKKLGIDRHLANLMFQDIAFSLVSSQSFGTSILTSSEKHVEILNAITDDKQLNENNKISRALLSAKVPLANDLNIADVLRLRKREQDSFILFRKCLRDAIGEYCKIKGSITDNQARDIYCSIIEPGLARLNKKVEKARRDLIKGARRELLGWAGAISFGVYSGFLNADILTMASAMGLATIATALKKIMKKSDFEEEVKQEDLYFLWKIKKLNNK